MSAPYVDMLLVRKDAWVFELYEAGETASQDVLLTKWSSKDDVQDQMLNTFSRRYFVTKR